MPHHDPLPAPDAEAGSRPTPGLDRVAERSSRALTALGEILLVGLALLVTVSVLLRAIAGIGLGFAEELSGFLLVAISFLGLAGAQRAGSIFRVDTLYERFPPALRRWLAIVFDVLALIFVVMLAWQVARHTWSSWHKGSMSADAPWIAMWMPQLLMPLGLAFLALALVAALVSALRACREGSGT